tara:strand:+ start:9464 stop:9763 length:300 start_codon:yes stop_codon:yes gene_type:complete
VKEETDGENSVDLVVQSPVDQLKERALRHRMNGNGPLEVNEEQFRLLLTEGGGRINGIHDVKHEEGYKTQQVIDLPDDGRIFIFVYTCRSGLWGDSNAP